MYGNTTKRWATAGLSAVLLLTPATLPRSQQAANILTPVCQVPDGEIASEAPLRHLPAILQTQTRPRVLAIGSSSTAGVGATSPYNTYPAQLEAILERLLKNVDLEMFNRGVSGEVALTTAERLKQEVERLRPHLVLWQVGTNSLLRGDPIAPHRSLLHGGIVRLKAINSDIVLIDPQYAPRVIARPNADGMIKLLQETARFETVNLFRRFALMRHWHQVERMPFEAFLSPDELHMNDFSYGCVARALGSAIAEALTRPVLSATTAPVAKR